MTYVQEAVRFSGWRGVGMLVRATKIKLQRKVGLVGESMFRFMFPRLQRIYGGSGWLMLVGLVFRLVT